MTLTHGMWGIVSIILTCLFFRAVPKPFLSEFGIHFRLESCELCFILFTFFLFFMANCRYGKQWNGSTVVMCLIKTRLCASARHYRYVLHLTQATIRTPALNIPYKVLCIVVTKFRGIKLTKYSCFSP